MFVDRGSLYRHRLLEHANLDELQQQPWEVDPWNGDEGLREEWTTNRGHILAPHRLDPVNTVYNFPSNNLSGGVSEISTAFEHVYQNMTCAFKAQICIGFILLNRETEEYRYFIPYQNHPLFDTPLVVSNPSQFREILHKIQNLDLEHIYRCDKPDTKFVPHFLTNFIIMVDKLSYPIGTGLLPPYIKQKKSVIALDTDSTSREYKDKLCAFRCLSCFFTPGNKLDRYLEYYHEWREFMSAYPTYSIPENPTDFSGVLLHLIPYLEECFKINILIVKYSPEGLASNVYNSISSFNHTMYPNLHENHFSYIKEFNSFAQKFQCDTCKKLFNRACDYKRHLKTCTGLTKSNYPGGFHSLTANLFEKLELIGVKVNPLDTVNPYFAVFDFESILQKIEENSGEKTKYFQKHKPVSVSVCSNLDGYRNPKCFVNENVKQLVTDMHEYLSHIQDSYATIMSEKYSETLDKVKEKLKKLGFTFPEDKVVANNMEERMEEMMELHEEIEAMLQDRAENTDPQTQNRDTQNTENPNEMSREMKFLLQIYNQLQTYTKQLPVFGFNSSNYDINLILGPLVKIFEVIEKEEEEEEEEPKKHKIPSFVIKNMNKYSCISTEKFKFLDLSNFLSAGSSYSQFLKAYGVTESKLFFPYEYLDCFEKLSETEFPSYDTFYSSLKQCNVLEAEHLAWQKSQKGPEPKTGAENYQMMLDLWHSKGMQTLKDLLILYNDSDVGPFVKGIEAMQKHYHEKNIDITKNFVSVPGIARDILFRHARDEKTYFSLFDEAFAHIHELFRKNCFGGPSIVFNRKLIQNQTGIRGDLANLIRFIIGLDANALYNWSISQRMPSGLCIYRDSETGFKPERDEIHTLMYAWLDYYADKNNCHVVHKLNCGQEYPIDDFLVDGLISGSQHVLEFQGCLYVYYNIILQ